MELGIYRPLVEAKMTKNDTIFAAQSLGLPIVGKSHNSCLATRLPYGEELTIGRLHRIDEAEEYIRNLIKPRDLRLREHGYLVRIELDYCGVLNLLEKENSTQVIQKLKKLGFRYVTIDLELHRSGSFDK